LCFTSTDVFDIQSEYFCASSYRLYHGSRRKQQGRLARSLARILFPQFNGTRNSPIIFSYMTGEMPKTLEAIVENIYFEVTAPKHFPRTPRTGRRCPCILDVHNRVLLVIIWLRQYLKLHVLAYIFGISKFLNYIKWPSLQQWHQFLDTFSSFSNAVGMIDGTIHRTHRPSGPLQAEFYRGDQRCYFMSSQMVVDQVLTVSLSFLPQSIVLNLLINRYLS
jgi:hypothetical protein